LRIEQTNEVGEIPFFSVVVQYRIQQRERRKQIAVAPVISAYATAKRRDYRLTWPAPSRAKDSATWLLH